MSGKIHRRKKSSDFVTLDTHCSRNKNLRWASKGLHTYLFQLPDDWQVNIADLENRSEDGRESTTSAMNALINAGYVVRERKHDDKGRFEGYDYFVFERPEHAVEWLTVNGKTVNGLTVNGKTATNKVLSYSKKSNSKNEGRENEEKAPTPETYDEFIDRVNSEAAAIRAFNEAKKKKNPVVANPLTIHSGFNEVFGAIYEKDENGEYKIRRDVEPSLPVEFDVEIHEPVKRERVVLPPPKDEPTTPLYQPTNPDAAKALLSRMNITPKADNEMDARKLIVEWCETHGEQVKWAYESAKRKQTPEDLAARIIDFSGHFATTDQHGKQLSFFNDPAFMFKNGLTKWLQRQNQFDREQSGSKFAPVASNEKYTAPIASPPENQLYHK